MLKQATLFLMCLFTVNQLFAGEWLYDKEILRPEVRDGTSVTVVLSDSISDNGTENFCASNRISFQNEKWINQDAVNQYLSLLLSVYALKQKLSVHVELEDGICYGRIAFPVAQ